MEVVISFATVSDDSSSCFRDMFGEPTFNTIQISTFTSIFTNQHI